MNIKLNVKHISKISVIEKLQDTNYEWLTEGRFLGFLTRTEGMYYTSWGSSDLTNTEHLRHRYVEDKQVFYKPHIEIITTDGKTTTFWFDTMREIVDFLNKEEFKEATWITYP